MFSLLLTLLLAPTYLIRFSVGPASTDLLMLWVVLVWLITAFILTTKKLWGGFLSNIKSADKKILVPAVLFFGSGVIGLLTGGLNPKNLGQFLVLYLQPISLFFIFGFWPGLNKNYKALSAALYLVVGLAGVYALVQYFTLVGLPVAYHGNMAEIKRATSFFGHPNFYALFAAPLLAFLLPDLGLKIKNPKDQGFFIASWAIGALGLLLSLSRSGWLGLGAAIAVYLFIAADKKIKRLAAGAAILALVLIILSPTIRSRITQPFSGERSAGSRVELWQAGWNGIKQSPVFGLGFTGFADKYKTLISDQTLDTHNYPHNIFLNFWVTTGLLGLISITWLLAIIIYRGLRSEKPTIKKTEPWLSPQTITISIALFLITILLQGQIDNPYLKNDLAMVFWLIMSLAI